MIKIIDLPDSVFAPDLDTQTIHRLEVMLAKAHPKLVGMDNEQITLPESIYQVLIQVIQMMAAGQTISLVPYNHFLSSQEAADLLNVSRPYLYKLLDQGLIAYEMKGTHSRILFKDLINYKQHRDSQRRRNLIELTELSQDLGFYNAPEAN